MFPIRYGRYGRHKTIIEMDTKLSVNLPFSKKNAPKFSNSTADSKRNYIYFDSNKNTEIFIHEEGRKNVVFATGTDSDEVVPDYVLKRLSLRYDCETRDFSSKLVVKKFKLKGLEDYEDLSDQNCTIFFIKEIESTNFQMNLDELKIDIDYLQTGREVLAEWNLKINRGYHTYDIVRVTFYKANPLREEDDKIFGDSPGPNYFLKIQLYISSEIATKGEVREFNDIRKLLLNYYRYQFEYQNKIYPLIIGSKLINYEKSLNYALLTENQQKILSSMVVVYTGDTGDDDDEVNRCTQIEQIDDFSKIIGVQIFCEHIASNWPEIIYKKLKIENINFFDIDFFDNNFYNENISENLVRDIDIDEEEDDDDDYY